MNERPIMFHMKHNHHLIVASFRHARGGIPNSVTESTPPERITVRGSSLPDAISRVLNTMLGYGGMPESGPLGDISARFQATEATIETLVPALLDSVVAIESDFGSPVISAAVDGIRPLEGAYRGWGTATLGNGAARSREITRIHRATIATEDTGSVIVTIEMQPE